MQYEERWKRVVMVCVALAVASLVFNISLPSEMAGHLQTWSFIRKSITKVLNSGTAWAAISIYAGWRMRRPLPALVMGIAAAEGTLMLHYLLGLLIGIYPSDILSSNLTWFIGGVVLSGPLGLVGWLASRDGWLGLAARLVTPAGALAEPWVQRLFNPYPGIPWPERWSSMVSGGALLAIGLVGAVVVLRHGRAGADGWGRGVARRTTSPVMVQPHLDRIA